MMRVRVAAWIVIAASCGPLVTRARATGQGLCYNFGRILAAVGALQMGHLLQLYEGSYAKAGATISLVYVLGTALIWFGPETKGKPLPD